MKLICEPSSHYTYGMSSAKRWMNCPASPWMEKGIPNEPSPYATEGTAAHKLCEHALKNDLDDLSGCVGWTIVADGEEIEVTEEMAEAVELYVTTVRATCDKFSTVFIEQHLALPWIGDDIGGTCDSLAINRRTLNVFDFKYGRGVMVEAKWNPQLIGYAVAALGTAKGETTVDKVVLRIVQPRAQGDKVKSWETTPGELLTFFRDHMQPAYARSKMVCAACETGKAPICYPGEHCGWCRGKGKPCTALYEHNRELTKATFHVPEFKSADKMTGADLAKMLRYCDLFKAAIKAYRERARHAAEHGVAIPGYKMVRTLEHRKWKDGAEEQVVKLFGERAWVKKLISPAQADKAAKKADVTDEAIAALVVRPEGKALVEDTDKRPAIVSSVAAELLSSADWLQ